MAELSAANSHFLIHRNMKKTVKNCLNWLLFWTFYFPETLFQTNSRKREVYNNQMDTKSRKYISKHGRKYLWHFYLCFPNFFPSKRATLKAAFITRVRTWYLGLERAEQTWKFLCCSQQSGNLLKDRCKFFLCISRVSRKHVGWNDVKIAGKYCQVW